MHFILTDIAKSSSKKINQFTCPLIDSAYSHKHCRSSNLKCLDPFIVAVGISLIVSEIEPFNWLIGHLFCSVFL